MTQAISKMETTAVEWLFEQIKNGNITSEKTDCGYLVMVNDNCLEQAKAMEKDQIVNAWMATDNELQRIAAEQYYNETYGSKDM